MKKNKIKMLVILAMFSALAFASLFVLHIGGIGGFLSFDIKDAIIMIASMALGQFGPVLGVIISLTVSAIEAITISTTGFWGFLMNFLSTAIFVSVGSSIYLYVPKIRKTTFGAIIGLIMAVLTTTVAMVFMNLLITPIYTGMPVAKIAEMIIPLLLPFNFLKAMLNAAIVLLIYKPISRVLKRTITGQKQDQFAFNRTTVIFMIVGFLIMIVAATLLIVALGGNFQWIVKK